MQVVLSLCLFLGTCTIALGHLSQSAACTYWECSSAQGLYCKLPHPMCPVGTCECSNSKHSTYSEVRKCLPKAALGDSCIADSQCYSGAHCGETLTCECDVDFNGMDDMRACRKDQRLITETCDPASLTAFCFSYHEGVFSLLATCDAASTTCICNPTYAKDGTNCVKINVGDACRDGPDCPGYSIVAASQTGDCVNGVCECLPDFSYVDRFLTCGKTVGDACDPTRTDQCPGNQYLPITGNCGTGNVCTCLPNFEAVWQGSDCVGANIKAGDMCTPSITNRSHYCMDNLECFPCPSGSMNLCLDPMSNAPRKVVGMSLMVVLFATSLATKTVIA